MIMQRRSFLAGVLALPAVGVIAREVTRAEPAGLNVSPYLTPKDAWYLPDYPGRPEISSFNRTRPMTAKQTREMLERVLNEEFSAIYGSSGL
jgi:hypothetical protein